MTSTTSNASAFEEAIAVTPLTSHTYSADLQESWCIGTVPHGGYTTAVLYRLVKTHFAHTHPTLYKSAPVVPISIQLSFLRRTAAGKAMLTVQDVKLGARTSTLHVTVSQTREGKKKHPQGDGDSATEEALEAKVAGYITVSPPMAEVGASGSTSWTLHPPSLPGSGPNGRVNLSALAAEGRDGVWERSQHDSKSFRWAGQHIEVFSPAKDSAGPDRRATVEQWARFQPGGERKARWTDEAVAYLVDMFPEALDELGRVASSGMPGNHKTEFFWYPTVTLNVEVKKQLPLQGVEWLYSRIHSKVIRNGRTDINVVVLDEEGEIIAVASQVGLVVSASRNIGQRMFKGAKERL